MGTSQVKFGPPVNFQAWLPTCTLEDVCRRRVRVAPMEEFKAAVDKHPDLEWNDKVAAASEQEGTVLTTDSSNDNSQVKFDDATWWVPTEVLTDVESAGDSSASSS